MTVPWSQRAKSALSLATAAREAAQMFPHRTHPRKLAMLSAAFMRSEAAYYASQAEQEPTQ